MAHYAYIDEIYIVTEVFVGKDETNFDWEQYYGGLVGLLCKRTSYNTRGGFHVNDEGIPDGGTPFRKNYAGVGYTYDVQRDAFIPPKPYPSWGLNEFSCLWEAPVPYPADGKLYAWNEELQRWDLLENGA